MAVARAGDAHLFAGESTLALPVREPRAEDAELPEFHQPEESAPLKTEVLRPGPAGRRLTHDLATGRVELQYDWEVGGVVRLPNGLEVSDRNFTTFSIVEGDPLSARVRSETSGALGRGDWRTRCESVLEMTCDAESFHVQCTVRAWEGEKPAFEKTWKRSFPRDLVYAGPDDHRGRPAGERRDLLGRHRAREVIALAERTAALGEEAELLARLDALGKRDEAERACKADDRRPPSWRSAGRPAGRG